jgi:hypothetical protein
MTQPSMTLETSHETPGTVAAAVSPDNTDEMTTTVRDDVVRTTIDRATVSGLRATATDYIANVQVADAVAAHAETHHDTHQ